MPHGGSRELSRLLCGGVLRRGWIAWAVGRQWVFWTLVSAAGEERCGRGGLEARLAGGMARAFRKWQFQAQRRVRQHVSNAQDLEMRE